MVYQFFLNSGPVLRIPGVMDNLLWTSPDPVLPEVARIFGHRLTLADSLPTLRVALESLPRRPKTSVGISDYSTTMVMAGFLLYLHPLPMVGPLTVLLNDFPVFSSSSSSVLFSSVDDNRGTIRDSVCVRVTFMAAGLD